MDSTYCSFLLDDSHCFITGAGIEEVKTQNDCKVFCRKCHIFQLLQQSTSVPCGNPCALALMYYRDAFRDWPAFSVMPPAHMKTGRCGTKSNNNKTHPVPVVMPSILGIHGCSVRARNICSVEHQVVPGSDFTALGSVTNCTLLYTCTGMCEKKSKSK